LVLNLLGKGGPEDDGSESCVLDLTEHCVPGGLVGRARVGGVTTNVEDDDVTSTIAHDVEACVEVRLDRYLDVDVRVLLEPVFDLALRVCRELGIVVDDEDPPCLSGHQTRLLN